MYIFSAKSTTQQQLWSKLRVFPCSRSSSQQIVYIYIYAHASSSYPAHKLHSGPKFMFHTDTRIFRYKEKHTCINMIMYTSPSNPTQEQNQIQCCTHVHIHTEQERHIYFTHTHWCMSHRQVQHSNSILVQNEGRKRCRCLTNDSPA